ncbi:MAG: DNRLRE domain-containing protein [Clostridia bacterium]|nr:DNRLRE domain-containing protein [Clostridia bacterium]
MTIVLLLSVFVSCGDSVETEPEETIPAETDSQNTAETDAETEAPETDPADENGKEEEPDQPAPVGDPVNATFLSVADTYVQMNSTDDFGAAEKIMAKTADTKGLTRHAFVRFDLSGLTVSNIEKVTVRLYCLFASDKKAEISGRDYKLYAITSDWDEMGMTWDTQPEAGEKVADIDTTSAAKGKWIEIDVTEYVKANLTKYVSFAIYNDGAETEDNHINMGSREVAGQEPQLVVEGRFEEGKALTLIENSAPEKEEKEPEVEEKAPLATLLSVADTYVQANSTDDFGAAESMRVKSADSKGLSRKSFLRFDLTTLKISEIDKVTLRLYCLFADETQAEKAARQFKLYAVTSPWNEMGMTWDTQPAVGVKIADIDTVDAKKGLWIEVDVTEYVKNNLVSELSFMICNEGSETETNHINFGTREAKGQEPQLVFEGTYEEGKELPVSSGADAKDDEPAGGDSETCAHKIALSYKHPDAASTGYVMLQCTICGYIEHFEFLGVDLDRPVVVTETIIAKEDAYVQAGSKADTNFGAVTELFVKKDGNNSRASFITFDMVYATPDEIDNAVLRLMVTYSGEWTKDTKDQDYKLYAVDPSSWNESEVTWNKMLAIETSFVFVTDVETTDSSGKRLYRPNDWIEIDVTDYVREYVAANPGKAISFVLRDEGNDNSGGHIKFASRETDNAPVLVVEGTFDPEAIAPTPDTPTPDAPTPDEPTPDTPTPDEPAPDAPAQVEKTVTAKADTYVQAGSKADTNFAAEATLFVKADGKNSRVSFLTFDTVSATADEIDSVILRLMVTYSGEWTKDTKDQDYKLYAVDPSSWNATELTWNKMLDIESSFVFIMDVETINDSGKRLYKPGDWIEIDLTEYVKAYVTANPGKELSFVLRDEGNDNSGGQMKFASSESENAPQLFIKGTFSLEEIVPTPDPVEKTLTAKADTYVQNGSKVNTNYGTESSFLVKIDGNNSRYAFVAFDLVNATADEIDSVIFRLHVTFSGEWTKDTKDQDYKIYIGDSASWDETTLTWNKMLEIESAFEMVADIETIDENGKRLYKPGEWIEIDVTEYIKDYVTKNPGKSVSFMIRDEGGANSNGQMKFASRESENGPQLIVKGTFAN